MNFSFPFSIIFKIQPPIFIGKTSKTEVLQMPSAIKLFQGNFEYFKKIDFFQKMNFSKKKILQQNEYLKQKMNILKMDFLNS